MIIMIIIIIIMAEPALIYGLILYDFLKTKAEEWGIYSFPIAFIIIVMVSCVVNTHQLPEKRDDIQNQVNHAIEDGASNYERKTIREEKFKINKKISEAKRDNSNWLWDLQIPDLVDSIAPVRMIE